MRTEVKNICDLNPAVYNPRVYLEEGDPDYEKLKQSIEKFGHVIPVVWNERTGNVVGGHQSLTVLKNIGKTEVQCVIVNLDENDEKTLNIALNKITGRWDMEKLDQVMEELVNAGMQQFTGFDEKEIEKMMEDLSTEIMEIGELAEEDYQEEAFEHKCPRCGFLY